MRVEVLLLLLVLFLLAAWFYPRWRRQRLLSRPFPSLWRQYITRYLPMAAGLSAQEYRRLQDMVTCFIDEKAWYGCDGFVINDEVRVAIAAQACLLRLHRSGPLFPRVRHILVYPDSFVVSKAMPDAAGLVRDEQRALSGEAWQVGKVILSWNDIVRHRTADGHNVVLHEFAHQIDAEDGAMDGVPPLREPLLSRWLAVVGPTFNELHYRVSAGLPTLLDPYGASDPVEFFPVATEMFFDRPHAIAQAHPDLFTVLCDVYAVDPRRWYPQ